MAYCQMDIFCFLLLCNAIIYSHYEFCSAASDTVTLFQSINDTQTLVSSGGTFEMGFFSPGTSQNRYLGMWYKNIPDRRVVWVANRVSPINDSSGVLMFNQSSGNLEIISHNMTITVWAANSTRKLQNPIAQLLDSGNLVLRDEKDEDDPDLYAWQSFDYPSDTFLPGMKIGWDAKSGRNRRITAWKNPNDPSPGLTSLGIELSAYPEPVLWKGSQKRSRAGPWIGSRFGDVYQVKPSRVFVSIFVFNEYEVYNTFYLKNRSVIHIPVVNDTKFTRDGYVWTEGDKSWLFYSRVPRDTCANYGICGNYGICSIDDFPLCKCFDGFTPKSPARWELGDWSEGCVRDKPLECSRKNKFAKVSGIKLPDTPHTWLNQSMNLEECELECLSNCSCVAYTNSDIRNGGSGCAIWFFELMDIRRLQDGGQDLYIRMPFSKTGVEYGSQMETVSAFMGAIIFFVLVTLIAIYCIYRRRTTLKDETVQSRFENHTKEDDMELPVFDVATIVKATNSFSIGYKLGEGGFGPVYKGTLDDGQEIAVKRLSGSSGQGQDEFKNEIRLVTKLAHRNLVKLLGCCIGGTERMLIYEFMPNGSLDNFIFDQTSSMALDWARRFTIINGVARGLLYLHQDSRLRIIHRDLKASNVLLDNEMNPKISDFGMAKIFGGDQTEVHTERVAGTYGYMAPEYAISGRFSFKSDVYSFGVLLLEIISGKRNREFVQKNHYLHLVEHTWKMWIIGRAHELIDESIVVSYSLSKVIRCIHIGLLCLQQHPRDRPGMTSVVLMLGSENKLPPPSEPAIFRRYSNKDQSISVNEVTMTSLEPR